MTEAEWLAATDLAPMLEFLRDKASDRKLRLSAVALCRRVWPMSPDDRTRRAVDFGEMFADDNFEDAIRGSLEQDTLVAALELRPATGGLAYTELLRNEARLLMAAESVAPLGEVNPVRIRGYCHEGGFAEAGPLLLRDIFGNPFRPVAFSPAWRTSTVLALAEGIYADRAFARLPILADALQDAGCDSDDILNHCRGGGEHCRGCWVVDLILGKE